MVKLSFHVAQLIDEGSTLVDLMNVSTALAIGSVPSSLYSSRRYTPSLRMNIWSTPRSSFLCVRWETKVFELISGKAAVSVEVEEEEGEEGERLSHASLSSSFEREDEGGGEISSAEEYPDLRK